MLGEAHPKLAMLERNKVGEGTVEFNGIQVAYFITAKDMPMREHGLDLAEHLGYWDGELLFVSEAVPADFREYVLWHELREYTELGGNGTPGACLQASTEELERVPDMMRYRYVRFRARQFDRLVELFGSWEGVFADNLNQSLTFWKQQC